MVADNHERQRVGSANTPSMCKYLGAGVNIKNWNTVSFGIGVNSLKACVR